VIDDHVRKPRRFGETLDGVARPGRTGISLRGDDDAQGVSRGQPKGVWRQRSPRSAVEGVAGP
jgi:hypothetical protein